MIQRKKTDEAIIETIKDFKVLTQRELENILNYKYHCLDKRLRKLINDNKIKYKRFSGKVPFLKGYMEKKLYFIDEESFAEWIRDHIPKRLSPTIRSMITTGLHNIGISIDLTPERKIGKKQVVMDEELHEKVKKLAEKKGVFIEDIMEKAVKEYLQSCGVKV